MSCKGREVSRQKEIYTKTLSIKDGARTENHSGYIRDKNQAGRKEFDFVKTIYNAMSIKSLKDQMH